MDNFVAGKNPYEVLGLESGQQSSLTDIKKAFRRLALVKHPDKAKTTDKERAAAEFDEIQKAYAILSDKSARAALDDYLEVQAAREKRLAQQDAKRQRMREELERKERAGAATRSEEDQARARLKAELDALRARAQQEQRAKQQQQQQQAAAAAAAASSAAGAAGQPAAVEDETTELLLRTVKVTWDPAIGSYTTARLRELFSEKFIVEDVILKDSKKSKRKASALVVLDTREAAGQAAHEVFGDLKHPLLVTPYLKVVPHAQQEQQQAVAGGAAAAPGTGNRQRLRTAPLFAGGGGAGADVPRPPQRPNKPLFPGAQATPAQDGSAARTATAAATAAAQPGGDTGSGSSKPKGFSSFPGMPAAAAGAGGAKAFSSFPGMPAGGLEQSVLQKLQQKSQGKQQ